ncbi:excinuclease ABC subunit UvrA [Peribacillus muralis]|nr:excinuclease ABC subunit UvrA [Peribacillus muralis]MCK2015880.1 excinuclease ABC subunit UvrA [Peribacillus muralis]
MGLSPSISVGQHNNNRNPRSTVGTVTEIYTYIRVLFARLGERTCPHCQKRIKPELEGQVPSLLKESDDLGEELSETNSIQCPHCQTELPLLTMAHFSFNKTAGACTTCSGIGIKSKLQLDRVLHEDLTIAEGAVNIWDGIFIAYNIDVLQNAAKHYGFVFNADVPIREYNELQRTLLLEGIFSETIQSKFPDVKPPKSVGGGRFEGIIPFLMKKNRDNLQDEESGKRWTHFFAKEICSDCQGKRLKKESREVTVDGKNIVEVSEMPLSAISDWLYTLQNSLQENAIVVLQPILDDLSGRIDRLLQVGLGYLAMSRSAVTVSGGEAQRLRIASLLGSGLTGVLYILDEPTTGLHPRDTNTLIAAMKRLRDLGNTVVLIEHDPGVMEHADYLIDIGPGSGRHGGQVVATGTPQEVKRNEHSVTAPYLFMRDKKGWKQSVRVPLKHINVEQAELHNVKDVTVSLPLGTFTSVTGVSGSGKSTFLFDIVQPALENQLGKTKASLKHACSIHGVENINRVITVNQEAVGKVIRSNVATYTDLFTSIRNLYAKLPQSKQKKLTAKHFSFNTPGGRCEKCKGLGILAIDMHFLPDVQVTCPVCLGKRFKKEVLEISYRGLTISEVLDITIEESILFFTEEKELRNKLQVLEDVGLGYIKLGQPTSTLSGGEAQRIKLSKELSKPQKGHTLYLLDEPTTGLHPVDIEQLLRLLNRLVDQGNTVIVIEHNLDVIAGSDWLIDFGPEGGNKGGHVVAAGTPQDVSKVKTSYTGQALQSYTLS